MSFRARLFLAFLAVIIVPMAVFALAVRREMGERLTAEYERRVESLLSVIEDDLEQRSTAIASALAGLTAAAVDDNRFRQAAVDRLGSERRYLLDYAAAAMRLTGLTMLQIQDESGRIVSSGHFRNEYDRMEPELPELLPETPKGVALVQARAPESPFIALVRADSFQMGGRRFTMIGGVTAGQRLLVSLARDRNIRVSLIYPGGVLSSSTDSTADDLVANSTAVVRELDVPFVDGEADAIVPARIRVSHSLAELEALRRRIDVWFLIAVAVTAVAALLLANWLSSRLSRPLAELARKTSRIDLDRLDVDFDSRRRDEVGALSRLLGAMTQRLRVSAARIKEVERRATLGEMARQVNHDIKNGLVPIRNVFRHLAQTARDEPERLPDVFGERRGTVDSSVAYLENLASNYARLYPRLDRQPCDVNAVARLVATDASGSGRADVRIDLCDGSARVIGDPLALRRIFENLMDNAIDSLESKAGYVVISSERVEEEGEARRIRVVVADTGTGVSADHVEKIFDDFYTTKANGTGLGLSIVRRLVMDLSGSVTVESEPGQGSRFIVDLPLAGHQPGASPAGPSETRGNRP